MDIFIVMDKRFIWTIKEIEKLKELYSDYTNFEIAELLNKSKNSIDNKAFRLKLKKSNELLTRISKEANLTRISKGGRDLTLENLKNIALKYKTRIEFKRNDDPAYNSARIKGVLDEICSHMTVLKFSTPQLILRNIMDKLLNSKSIYNTRRIIKPYEIDVYYPEFNLAFEYQGKNWHNKPNEKNRDLIKKKLFNQKNINIIYIYEKTKDYEKDIKNQLIKHIVFINKISNSNLIKDDILNCEVNNIYSEVYNKEELIAIAKKYNSFKEFKKREKPTYRKLYNLKLMELAANHMKDYCKRKVLGLVKIKEIISKYDNLTDFRLNENSLYKNLKKTKRDHLIKHLRTKKQTYPEFTTDIIKNVINKYNEKCDFIADNMKMYRYIRHNNLTYLLKKLKRCTKQAIY